MTASPTFALFLVRIGFGAFIALWGLHKVLQPEAAARMFAAFYDVEALSGVLATGLGGVQVAIGLAIVAGFARTFSYGAGLLIHVASSLAIVSHLVAPLAQGSNIVFWTSVPVLLAAVGLFLARGEDTFLSVDAMRFGARGLPTRS